MIGISIYLYFIILMQFLTCVICLPVGFPWDAQSNASVNPTEIVNQFIYSLY